MGPGPGVGDIRPERLGRPALRESRHKDDYGSEKEKKKKTRPLSKGDSPDLGYVRRTWKFPKRKRSFDDSLKTVHLSLKIDCG